MRWAVSFSLLTKAWSFSLIKGSNRLWYKPLLDITAENWICPSTKFVVKFNDFSHAPCFQSHTWMSQIFLLWPDVWLVPSITDGFISFDGHLTTVFLLRLLVTCCHHRGLLMKIEMSKQWRYLLQFFAVCCRLLLNMVRYVGFGYILSAKTFTFSQFYLCPSKQKVISLEYIYSFGGGGGSGECEVQTSFGWKKSRTQKLYIRLH